MHQAKTIRSVSLLLIRRRRQNPEIVVGIMVGTRERSGECSPTVVVPEPDAPVTWTGETASCEARVTCLVRHPHHLEHMRELFRHWDIEPLAGRQTF